MPVRQALEPCCCFVLLLQGEVVGEVRQRWHPWRRNYDLYIGKRQFATISGGFLAWEFELKDVQGNTLALIDRSKRVGLEVALCCVGLAGFVLLRSWVLVCDAVFVVCVCVCVCVTVSVNVVPNCCAGCTACTAVLPVSRTPAIRLRNYPQGVPHKMEILTDAGTALDTQLPCTACTACTIGHTYILSLTMESVIAGTTVYWQLPCTAVLPVLPVHTPGTFWTLLRRSSLMPTQRLHTAVLMYCMYCPYCLSCCTATKPGTSWALPRRSSLMPASTWCTLATAPSTRRSCAAARCRCAAGSGTWR